MSYHAPLAPSSSHRWLQCPGSRFGSPGEGGEAADLGTVLHEAAARRLRGEAVTVQDLDDEYLVDRFVHYVEELYEFEPNDLSVEEYLSHPSIEDFGGTPDAVVVKMNELHVIDLKTGRVPVAAEDNKQLACYLILARRKYGNSDSNHYYGHIIQRDCVPRVAEFTEAELDRIELQIAVAAQSGPDDRTAGEWCQYCPLISTCGTAMVHHEKLSNDMFGATDRPLTLEEARSILEWEGPFEDLVKNAKEIFREHLSSGGVIKGWRLGRQRGHRKWADENEAATVLTRKDLWDIYAPQKLKSPAQIEKQHGKDITRELAEAGHIVQPDLGVVVCKESSRISREEGSEMFLEN